MGIRALLLLLTLTLASCVSEPKRTYNLVALAYKGDMAGIEAAVAHGADVNMRDERGTTPLIEAVTSGHSDIAKFLLAHGAKIYEKDKMLWLTSGHKEMLWLAKQLIDQGANVNYEVDGRTPLSQAASLGHTGMAKLLLAHGAQIDNGTISPLFLASVGGQINMVAFLLDHGADVNSHKGFTALRGAVLNGKSEVAMYLLEHGAKIFDKNRMLHAAAAGGVFWMAKRMIDQGADVNYEDSGFTVLDEAVMQRDSRLVKLLLAHGAKPTKDIWRHIYSDDMKRLIRGALPAPQLFGVDLVSASRKTFRLAVKQAGAKTLREDNQSLFDKYDSSRLLEGSDLMVAAYVAKKGKLASVEFRFPNQPRAQIQIKDRRLVYNQIMARAQAPNASTVDKNRAILLNLLRGMQERNAADSSASIAAARGIREIINDAAQDYGYGATGSTITINQLTKVKNMIEKQYGPPDSSSGRDDIGAATYWWIMEPVSISVRRTWPDGNVFLHYFVNKASNEMLSNAVFGDHK